MKTLGHRVTMAEARYTKRRNARLICLMAGQGRTPMSLLGAGSQDVDGRDTPGHDTWGACVNLFAAWY
jgi:hypothetical protein